MAVYLATTSDYLQRTTGLLALTTANATRMAWVKNRSTVTGVGSTIYSGMNAFGDNSSGASEGGLFTNNTNHSELYVARPGGFFTDFTGNPISVGDWHHVCWTVSGGTTHKLFLDGLQQGTSFSFNLSSGTPAVTNIELLGSDGITTTADHDIAYYRAWNGTALTASQIQAEMASTTPQVLTNLYQDNPLASDYADKSGNGHDWTAVGSPSFSSSPTLPGNGNPANALAITSLPYTNTQTMSPPFTIWYRYTAAFTDEFHLLGFGDLSNFQPMLNVYSPDSATPYLSVNANMTAGNIGVQLPVVAGTTYYFQLIPNLGSVAPVTLTVTAQLFGGNQVAPAGSLLIPDDTAGYPGAVISSTTATMLQFRQGLAAGEGGDVLATSRQILLSNIGDNTLVRYTAQLVSQGTTSFTPGTGGQKVLVRANQTSQKWYAGQRNFSSAPQFVSITSAGTQTALATLSSVGMTAFAVNDDESKIYLAGNTTITSSNIRVWNVGGAAFGTDLVAAVANYKVTDMLYLEDQTLLVMYIKTFSPGDIRVVRYDTSGTTLNTYTLASGVTIPSNNFGYRIAFASTSPAAFWAWYQSSDGGSANTGLSNIVKVTVATGTISAPLVYNEYEAGIYFASPTASPAPFGISRSCPFIELREALPATPNGGGGGGGAGTPQVFPIRRVRITPTLAHENRRMYHRLLVLDVEPGVGSDGLGQGVDPVVMMRYSDDSGNTWSDELRGSIGKIGAYGWQVFWPRLGMGRARVYEFVCSDPDNFTLGNAYVEVEEGTGFR